MKTIRILTLGLIMTASVLTASAQYQFKDAQDSICMVNYSLFNQNFKMAKQTNAYEEAYEPWKIVVATCPKKHKNLYINGATMLKNMYAATKDTQRRNELIDELMKMYELRIANFGEAAMVTARAANDMENLCGESRLKDYYELYSRAMSLGADQLDLPFIERFFDATVKYVTSGNADTTLIVDNYDLASDALDGLMSKETDSVKRAQIRGVTNQIENRFSPFASCEELVKIYTKKFEANPEDTILLKKITTILRKKKCMDTELFFAATNKLHSLIPTSSSAYLMAQMNYQRKQYSEAAAFVTEAVKDADDKYKYNMYILQGMCYAEMNSYSAARTAFNKAAEADPSKGEPYRRIAMLYAQGAKAVNDNMGGRTAYWAAVDAARKSISVDNSPENVEAAQSLINAYSSHFPSQDAAFMYELYDGNSYTVPGWIGVSTTVRTRK